MIDSGSEKYKIFDYLLEGCQVIDFDMKYVYLNDAAVRHSKYDKAYLLGKSMFEVYQGIEKTEMYSKLIMCMNYGMSFRLTNAFEYPDKSTGWFELVMQKIPEGVLILSNDISERILGEKALMDAYDRTIESWSRALEFRDNETEGHTLRVTEMAMAFAKSLSPKGMDYKFFKYGCLMHDIGKIGVPDEILKKNRPLSDDEWVIMKKHPEIARALMKPIEFLDKASEIPYYHHEWVNGAGYPNGVKGDEIPLSSRIFSIIDVYDALTSDRPYREAWTHEVAMAYIIDLSDKQFDSKLVNAFVTFIEQYRKGL